MNHQHIKNLWLLYKDSQDKSQYSSQILRDAENYPSTLWAAYFRADPQMSKKLLLIETKDIISQSRKNYESLKNQGQDTSAIINAIANLAHSMCRNSNNCMDFSLDEDKKNIWHKAFSDDCLFASSFQQIHDNYLEQEISLKLKEIAHAPAILPVLQTIELLVPYKFTVEHEKPSQLIPKDLLHEIKDHYDAFRLDAYMKLSFLTQNTKLEIEPDGFHFKFDVVSDIENPNQAIAELKNALKVQLINGWGQSWSQHGRLVGCHVIYPGFDVDHMTVIESAKPFPFSPKM